MDNKIKTFMQNARLTAIALSRLVRLGKGITINVNGHWILLSHTEEGIELFSIKDGEENKQLKDGEIVDLIDNFPTYFQIGNA